MQNAIETQILTYQDPVYGFLFTKKNIQQIAVSEDVLHIHLSIGFPFALKKAALIADLSTHLSKVSDHTKIEIDINESIESHVGKLGVQGLPGVKNIIAVASGKGGVGKSTVAVNLALALSALGAKVGLLDADIYGPSQPAMLGTKGKRPALENQKLQPISQYGIQSMSIGYLVEQHVSLAWRGPMLGKALQQLLQDTAWQNLDYLVIDLPPGTGDVQLTLCQKIPVSGALIVTTPQDLALIDVRRACEMFSKLNVPIMGVVENMSSYHCTQCGHEEKIFGEGAAKVLADEYQLKILAHIPLTLRMREMTDSGFPPVVSDANSQEANVFYDIAVKTAMALSQQAKDYSSKIPKIVVQHDK